MWRWNKIWGLYRGFSKILKERIEKALVQGWVRGQSDGPGKQEANPATWDTEAVLVHTHDQRVDEPVSLTGEEKTFPC